MKLFQIDIQVVATAYIKAESAKEAKRLADKEFTDSGYSLAPDSDLISGKMFSDPSLPDVSLSPAITFQKPYPGVHLTLDEAELAA